MKHFRLWLLLLLAVLLPVRGAFAAAMFCPPAGVGTQSEVRAPGHAAGQHATADVVMGRGPRPADNPRVFDAREVMANLGPSIQRPAVR